MGQPMPWRGLRWIIAQEHAGWTLEYIDNLDLQDILDRSAVLTGQAQANKPKGK